jgi:hypothetical protein
MAEQKECCGNCRFWLEKIPNSTDNWPGTCRRFPPDMWCSSASNEWCGEYELVKGKESEVSDEI